MDWRFKDRKYTDDSKTLVMGIVNVTPDSFSDGGDYFDAKNAIEHALKHEADGADFIDIGAQSTRPGSTVISAEEEWSRLEGVLIGLKGKLNVPISVDTFYPEVARKAIDAGAEIINDVSGKFNEDMAKIVKETGCGWIIMHNGSGTPEDVNNLLDEVAAKCTKRDIPVCRLCIDPGIGFGKDYEENIELLRRVNEINLGYGSVPVLLGVSRKRVIGQGSKQENPKERIYGNIAVDALAIAKGVNIIRLHDVEHEIQGIRMADAVLKNK